MSNILAIAHKELKSYFSSPIAYIAIGLWALLYGYFFVTILSFFVRQSMQMSQMGMQGPQAMNVNQQLIRPLLQNVTILILFLMPMVTMRTYSEEKRSGTIELLLTVAAHRLPDRPRQVPRRDGALRGDARRHAVARRHPVRLRLSRMEADRDRLSRACCSSAAASSRSGCSSRA